MNEPRIYYTYQNPKGASDVASREGLCVMAFPESNKKGYVKIINSSKNYQKAIKCHEQEIVCLSLSNDGSLLASASSSGTLIRVWSTELGKDTALHVLRRGTNTVEIYDIAFNKDASLVAISSSSTTIHIYRIKEEHINTFQ